MLYIVTNHCIGSPLYKLKRKRRRARTAVSEQDLAPPSTSTSRPKVYNLRKSTAVHASSSQSITTPQDSSDQVTVEDFLAWSAAAPDSGHKRKKRRILKLDKTDDVEALQVEEDDISQLPRPRRRRQGLPQLPASDDEYQPSEQDSSQASTSQQKNSTRGKRKSLSTRMLQAAVLSQVDVDAKHLPTGSGDRKSLKFGTTSNVTPPPAVLNPEKLRVIDPRKVRFQPSEFSRPDDHATKRGFTSWARPLPGPSSLAEPSVVQHSGVSRKGKQAATQRTVLASLPLPFTSTPRRHRRVSAASPRYAGSYSYLSRS